MTYRCVSIEREQSPHLFTNITIVQNGPHQGSNRSVQGIPGTLSDGQDDPMDGRGEMRGGKKEGKEDFLKVSGIYNRPTANEVDFEGRSSNGRLESRCEESKEVCVLRRRCRQCQVWADHCGFCPPPTIFAAQRRAAQSRFSLGLKLNQVHPR